MFEVTFSEFLTWLGDEPAWAVFAYGYLLWRVMNWLA